MDLQFGLVGKHVPSKYDSNGSTQLRTIRGVIQMQTDRRFQAESNTWTFTRFDEVERALTDPSLKVRSASEPVPETLVGTRAGQIFSNLARMRDGARHHASRQVVEAIIESIDLQELRDHTEVASLQVQADARNLAEWQTLVAPHALVRAFGIHHTHYAILLTSVEAFARAISPGASAEDVVRGIAASEPLWDIVAKSGYAERFDFDLDPVISNIIGLYFQAFDSTAGLLGNALIYLSEHPSVVDMRSVIRHVMHETPSIRNTRRFAAKSTAIGDADIQEGATLILDLEKATINSGDDASLAFGAGPHRCPGQLIAFTIAVAALESGPRLSSLPADGISWMPYPNARVPDFRSIPIEEATA